MTNQVMTTTFTGRYINMLDLQKDEVDITDICISLTRQRRYAGHTAVPWSVGQHSILGAMIAKVLGMSEDVQQAFVLHDTEEYLVQDVISPIKCSCMDNSYAQMSDKISATIYDFFGMSDIYKQESIMGDVKAIDYVCWILESLQLVPNFDYAVAIERGQVSDKVKRLVAKLRELEFFIPADLIHMSEADVAQNMFEVLNVIYTERVHGMDVSSEMPDKGGDTTSS